MAFGERSMRQRKETTVSKRFLEELLAPFLKPTVGDKAVLDLPDQIKVKFVTLKDKKTKGNGTQLRKREQVGRHSRPSEETSSS